MNISLGPQWESFIAESVQSGRYDSASDVIQDGLRLLRDRNPGQQFSMDDLRREVDQGIVALEQGDYLELDAEALKVHLERTKSRGRDRIAQMSANPE